MIGVTIIAIPAMKGRAAVQPINSRAAPRSFWKSKPQPDE